MSEEWTSIARRYWKEAGGSNTVSLVVLIAVSHTGVDHKVKLHIRPAVETLRQLLEQPGMAESFDFAFIDADKVQYFPIHSVKCV